MIFAQLLAGIDSAVKSSKMPALNRTLLVLNFILPSLLLIACDKQRGDESINSDVVRLQVWAHAGQEEERRVLQSQVERYNQQAAKIKINLTFIPERDYNAQVQAAALAGDLPDILEFDGP